MLFQRIHPLPLGVPAQTRDGTVYLLRGLKHSGANTSERYVALFRLWQIFNCTFVLLYMPFAYIYNYALHFEEISPGEFLNVLQYGLNSFSFGIKNLIILVNMSKLKRAIDLMDGFDERCTTREELLAVRQNVAFCNKIFFIFGVIYAAFINSSFVISLLMREPPYNIYLPLIDWRANSWQYWAHSLIEYVTIGNMGMQGVGIDSYPVIFVHTLRTHLRLLIQRVQRLGTGETVDVEARRKELVACIQDHKRMLAYCELIRPCISGTIFLQFLACGLILGLTVIYMLYFMDIVSGIASIIYLFAIALQSFPLCYSCNCMIEECDELSNKIFHSRWVDTDQSYKKVILFYLQRTQQPIMFVPFNLFPITLASNITAAKFALTVYTLAKNWDLQEKWA